MPSSSLIRMMLELDPLKGVPPGEEEVALSLLYNDLFSSSENAISDAVSSSEGTETSRPIFPHHSVVIPSHLTPVNHPIG